MNQLYWRSSRGRIIYKWGTSGHNGNGWRKASEAFSGSSWREVSSVEKRQPANDELNDTVELIASGAITGGKPRIITSESSGAKCACWERCSHLEADVGIKNGQ